MAGPLMVHRWPQPRARSGGSTARESAGSPSRARAGRCTDVAGVNGSSLGLRRGRADRAGFWWWRSLIAVTSVVLNVLDRLRGRS